MNLDDVANPILDRIQALVDDAAGPWVDRAALVSILSGKLDTTAKRFDLGNPLGWTSEQIRSNEKFNAMIDLRNAEDD